MAGGKMNLVVKGSGQSVKATGTVSNVKVNKTNKGLKTRVENLESRVQSEKFRKTITYLAGNVGQVNGNGSGYHAADITPIVSVGDGYNGRTGSKIRLHSSYLQFQFGDQTNASSAIRGKILVFKLNNEVVPSPYSSFITQNMMNYNTFVGGGFTIVDYNSSYNPDYFKDWKLIRQKNFTHKSDNISGQKVITSLSMGIKYNKGKGHTVQFDKSTDTLVGGQILVLILLDNGNNSGTASTLTNISNTAASTGLTLNYSIDHYYYDN